MIAVAIDSIDDYLHALKSSFTPSAAGNRTMVLQYDFTGRDTGICHAVIAAGTIQVARGSHPSPTVVVRTDFDFWLRIVTHDVDGLIAYQDGLFTVEGDIISLMDADLWFGHT